MLVVSLGAYPLIAPLKSLRVIAIGTAVALLIGTTYLVAPEPEALGNGLAHLLSDPNLRSSLATQAKAYVQQEFTPEAAHRKLGSFYTMMESKASGAGA